MSSTPSIATLPQSFVSAAESVRLADLVVHRLAFEASDRLEFVQKTFTQSHHEYAAVLEAGRVIGICSRSHIGNRLGQRYGFALFSKSPVRGFLLPHSLVITESTPMRTVLEQALARTGEAFDVKVVLVNDAGVFQGMIPVQALVVLQSRILADQFRFLQAQDLVLRQKNAELEHTLGGLHDSQQRLHKSEEQLRQAQKMEAVGRLAGGVAHDFNNLLTVIGGYCALLGTKTDGQTELRRCVNEVQKAADRAADLTRQLLAFSRRQILQPRLLNLNDIVMGMEPMLRRLIGEDIELRTEFHSALKCVKADGGQIEQVLMNLAVNARDAMPHGGRLTITTDLVALGDGWELEADETAAADEYCVIAVSDTGVGMTEQVQAHLFEPFFTTKGVGKGTGLGLATCYGIIQQSHGHIRVSSRPGDGASFRIYLPAVAEQLASRPAPPEHDLPRGCTGTLLVVEDEDAVRELTREVLTEAGFTVLTAPNGAEGLRVIGTQPAIDLLITDVIMPKMGGRELVEQLRRVRPEIKVIYVSGYTDDMLTRNGELEQDVAFINKPFTSTHLLRKVCTVLTAQNPLTPTCNRCRRRQQSITGSQATELSLVI